MKASMWEHAGMPLATSEQATCMGRTAGTVHRKVRLTSYNLLAMGFDPGSYTCRGLERRLPVNYGKGTSSQLIAASLRANHGLPSVARRD
eukprot:6180970-Pleurochrysis_carterae.AAC.1